jgi:hypothetical protein
MSRTKGENVLHYRSNNPIGGQIIWQRERSTTMTKIYEKTKPSASRDEDDLKTIMPGKTNEDEDLITEELLVEEFAIIHG